MDLINADIKSNNFYITNMKKIVQRFFPLFVLIALFSNCRKKAFDEYYGRPESLAAPVYQQLEAKGNFKNFLACIDKANYKATLSAAGYWTVFAPNDKAFQDFFTQRGITDVSQLDSGTCKQIVTYALVYNAFTKNTLGDYQASTGWVANQGFKRRTANYVGFYDDTVTNALDGLAVGQKVKALSGNRNGAFVLGDNNNKYIPYFTDKFLAGARITASDYNYFYPNTTYSGFNVVDATVVTPDLVAENGIIHETDKVLLPLPNLDQYLASNPQYSEFKKLFDKYMVRYILSPDATSRYKILTGGTDNIYIKLYNGSLGFSPNNENYLKLQDNDAQANGYTLFVPRNDVLKDYENSVLLENYKSLDQLPTQVIVDFLNAHMAQTNIFPSKFATAQNVQAEPPRFNSTTDIIDKKILSNGIFYGTSKVQQANVFSTVYGKAYLDPKYLLMTRMLDQNLRFTITVPNVKYTVIMISDSVLRANGYDYNTAQSQWQYTIPGTTNTTVSATINTELQRILATHIIPTPNGELDNLSGSGIIETLNGEYIKYNNGTFSSAGTQDSGYVVKVTGTKTAVNGRVYYADGILKFSRKTLANKIIELGGTSATASEFYNFATLLKNSTTYIPATGELTAAPIGGFYTVFVPNNAAIKAAAVAGLIPQTSPGSGIPNLTNNPAWTAAQKDSINDFIKYHFITRTTIAIDGKKSGTYETTYKKPTGDAGTLSVTNTVSSLQVRDEKARTANAIPANSNNLADRAIIHLIDNYLQYSPN
jgi:uncharacterized surface protein with fasciclin (FAS1) repeats